MLSSETLIRPEHILQLVCLPGYSKVRHFETVTSLWQKIHSQPRDSLEYQTAYRKSSHVSHIVRAAITRSNMEQAAADAVARENQNLGIGQQSCGICLEPFRMGGVALGSRSVSEVPVTLRCGDIFCYHCVALWLKKHTHCPALGCKMDFGDAVAIKAKIDSQVHQHDDELRQVLDMM